LTGRTKADLQRDLLRDFGLVAPAPRATAALLHIFALERRFEISKVHNALIRNDRALRVANRLHGILPRDDGSSPTKYSNMPVCGILSHSHHLFD
jgi:hypothetical protein